VKIGMTKSHQQQKEKTEKNLLKKIVRGSAKEVQQSTGNNQGHWK
jgi:hypothetical protein